MQKCPRLQNGWLPLLAVFLFTLPASLRADTGWLDQANDCASFESGLKKYYAGLAPKSTLSPAPPSEQQSEQQRELKKVVDEACGPRFKGCGFEICKSREPAVSSASTGNLPTANTSKHHTSFDNAYSRKVPWLNQEFTCEQFREQMQARYAPLGSFSELEENKKNELRLVLDAACSPRFAHCNFSNCNQHADGPNSSVPRQAANSNSLANTDSRNISGLMQSSSSSSGAATFHSASDLDRPLPRTLNQTDLEKLRAQELIDYTEQKLALRRLKLERAIQADKDQPLEWNRFEMPDESNPRVRNSSPEDSATAVPAKPKPKVTTPRKTN